MKKEFDDIFGSDEIISSQTIKDDNKNVVNDHVYLNGLNLGTPKEIKAAIDMGGSGQDLAMPNYSGNVIIQNLGSDTEEIGVGINAGKVTLTESVFAGSIIISGVGTLIDNSTGTASVDIDGLISKDTISRAVPGCKLLNNFDDIYEPWFAPAGFKRVKEIDLSFLDDIRIKEECIVKKTIIDNDIYYGNVNLGTPEEINVALDLYFSVLKDKKIMEEQKEVYKEQNEVYKKEEDKLANFLLKNYGEKICGSAVDTAIKLLKEPKYV